MLILLLSLKLGSKVDAGDDKKDRKMISWQSPINDKCQISQILLAQVDLPFSKVLCRLLISFHQTARIRTFDCTWE